MPNISRSRYDESSWVCLSNINVSSKCTPRMDTVVSRPNLNLSTSVHTGSMRSVGGSGGGPTGLCKYHGVALSSLFLNMRCSSSNLVSNGYKFGREINGSARMIIAIMCFEYAAEHVTTLSVLLSWRKLLPK